MLLKNFSFGVLAILFSLSAITIGENVWSGVDAMGNQTGVDDPPAPTQGAPSGLPADLGKTCVKRQSNAEKYLEALKGKNGQPPAQGCVDQSKKSYNACKANPNETPEVEMGDGLKGSPDSLKAAAQQGATRNGEKASTCKDERENTEKACKEMEDRLDQAIKENKLAKQQALAEAQPTQTAAIEKQYTDIEKQLRDQKTATHEVNNTATTAIGDYQTCWIDEATRAEWVANQAASTSASASSAPMKFAGEDALKEAGDEGFKDAGKSLVRDKVMSTGTEAVTNATEKAAVTGAVEGGEDAAVGAVKSGTGRVAGGLVNVATNLATGDVLGAVGSTGELGAGFIKAIPGALNSTLFGAFGFYFGSTQPAMGACDQPISDGIAADAAGCVQAGNMAAQALNGD